MAADLRPEHWPEVAQQLTPTGDAFGKTTGVWQIEAGTGAYDRVSGHGTDEFLGGPRLTLSLTGVISKAG